LLWFHNLLFINMHKCQKLCFEVLTIRFSLFDRVALTCSMLIVITFVFGIGCKTLQ
jgi:hypothetical protein